MLLWLVLSVARISRAAAGLPFHAYTGYAGSYIFVLM